MPKLGQKTDFWNPKLEKFLKFQQLENRFSAKQKLQCTGQSGACQE
jgi:hypothetical protein